MVLEGRARAKKSRAYFSPRKPPKGAVESSPARKCWGERKKFWQGLIRVAVALHHLRNGNRVGAERLLAAAVEKLAGDSPERELIDVDALLAALAPLRKQISAGDSSETATPPSIYWKEPPDATAS